MNADLTIENIVVSLVAFAVSFAIWLGIVSCMHLLLTLPMRRAERVRLFLDLLEGELKDGRPVEQTFISISYTQDAALGARFHQFAAWLEAGASLSGAMDDVPGFLPPKIRAMFRAGQHLGDMRKVLPACRQLLRDAASETRSAVSYLFMWTFLTTPLAFVVYVYLIPKFHELQEEFGARTGWSAFVFDIRWQLLDIQLVVVAALVLAGLLFIGGPRVMAWFPILDRLPWRRKRIQRDFSTMLGILLDSGVPEPEAVRLAADCSANIHFQRRARRVIARLSEGVPLPQAIQELDDTGEFGWRLRNAFHARANFLRALAGWHESLDAKAFQEEQAASHGISTALVLWNGLFVGVIVTSIFMVLISITNSGVLW